MRNMTDKFLHYSGKTVKKKKSRNVILNSNRAIKKMKQDKGLEGNGERVLLDRWSEKSL